MVNTNDQAQAILGPIEWVASLPSTNTALRQRIAAGEAVRPGAVLAAHHQTAGRGRQERVWQSGAGGNLTFSCLGPPASPARIVSLPMAAALAVTDLLAQYGIGAATKWPNDVLVGGKKICGLLAETAADANGTDVGLVIGIGLNVNMRAADAAAIERPATSMHILTGRTYKVTSILDALLPLLAHRLRQWRADGFNALRSDWEARAMWRNRTVALHTAAGPVTGVLRGYGDSGSMLLEVDGDTRTIWSAELIQAVTPR